MPSTPSTDPDSSPSGAFPAEDLAGAYRRRLEGAIGFAFRPGNRVEWLVNGREIFPAMLEAIRVAERSVEFLTFVYWGARSRIASPERWPSGRGPACACGSCSTPSGPPSWTTA